MPYVQGDLFEASNPSIMDSVVSAGQYKGMTWRYVLEYDLPYCKFITSQSQAFLHDPDTIRQLRDALNEHLS